MTLWRFIPDLMGRIVRGCLTSDRLLDAQPFHRALERERMRADRLGSSFSFLEFKTSPRAEELGHRVAHLLEQRLRLTDEIGRYGMGIGVILPETPLESARSLAMEISASAGATDRIPWRACVYPADSCETDSHIQAVECSAVPLEPTGPRLMFVKPLPLWKRGIDLGVASCGLLLALPVLVAAAIAIKATSPGPVCFLQRRTGLGGRPFTIYKLRTMRFDADRLKAELRAISEQDGPAFKLRNDPRVTRVGKYLRKTCIDELPQLWNVLRGDMTLVGPRPLPCDESDGCAEWQRRRLDVTPGLTCIWQVNSGRSRVAFADWMRMDLRYIRGRTLRTDLKLIWKTLVAVILHRASH